MTKEKIVFYHKEDKTNFKKVEEDNMEDFIKNIRNCDQCKTVEELKSSGTLKGRLTELHSEEDIIKALEFADKGLFTNYVIIFWRVLDHIHSQ